jgi:predicted dehydrogenase
MAFGTVAELVSSPDVDIVTVTVKVPHHFELWGPPAGRGRSF